MMKPDVLRRPTYLLLCGLLMLVGCGGSPETGLAPAEEPLGSQESALCGGSSVSNLTILGISTYQGEMAGSGSWAVASPANAVRLEYYLNGVLRSSDERIGTSGNWYFSAVGLHCGTHSFEVRAYPMVVDSAGNRSTCWDAPRSLPRAVIENCSAASIAAGPYHTSVLATDGSIWAWGSGLFGAIGDGTTNDRTTPIRVPGIDNVKAVAVGYYHTVALKHDGTVWTWGYNSDGQLGNGTTNSNYSPAQVPGLYNIVAIAAGGSFTLAVRSDGTVWSWGDNWCGPLGDGTETRRLSPVQVVGLSGVKAVAAGVNHSVALKQDGTVWTWGRNTSGELGAGTTDSIRTTPVQVRNLGSIVSIAASYWHTMAVRQDGTAWTWGDNRFGQAGDGTTTDHYTPVQVWGLGNVKVMSGGYGYVLAVKHDGTVWSWGYNNNGQLGTGTTTSHYTPVKALIDNVTTVGVGSPSYHSTVVRSDGTAWAWGSHSGGTLGNGSTTQSSTPVRVANLGP